MSKAAVVIFARAPLPGRVKTRLVPPLSPPQALGLHVACLRSTAALIASLPRSVHKYIYFSGPAASARRHWRELLLPDVFAVRTQGRGDLGERLRRMFAGLLAAGYLRVVVIGSDSPTLPRRRLLAAFSALRRADVVIGSTEDGGYYLLGCRKLVREIFRRIPWGSSTTYARTLARLERLQIPYRILPRWYDVDRPRDLARLRREVTRRAASHLAPLKGYFNQPPPSTRSS